jgi:hypothetical protein
MAEAEAEAKREAAARAVELEKHALQKASARAAAIESEAQQQLMKVTTQRRLAEEELAAKRKQVEDALTSRARAEEEEMERRQDALAKAEAELAQRETKAAETEAYRRARAKAETEMAQREGASETGKKAAMLAEMQAAVEKRAQELELAANQRTAALDVLEADARRRRSSLGRKELEAAARQHNAAALEAELAATAVEVAQRRTAAEASLEKLFTEKAAAAASIKVSEAEAEAAKARAVEAEAEAKGRAEAAEAKAAARAAAAEATAIRVAELERRANEREMQALRREQEALEWEEQAKERERLAKARAQRRSSKTHTSDEEFATTLAIQYWWRDQRSRRKELLKTERRKQQQHTAQLTLVFWARRSLVRLRSWRRMDLTMKTSREMQERTGALLEEASVFEVEAGISGLDYVQGVRVEMTTLDATVRVQRCFKRWRVEQQMKQLERWERMRQQAQDDQRQAEALNNEQRAQRRQEESLLAEAAAIVAQRDNAGLVIAAAMRRRLDDVQANRRARHTPVRRVSRYQPRCHTPEQKVEEDLMESIVHDAQVEQSRGDYALVREELMATARVQEELMTAARESNRGSPRGSSSAPWSAGTAPPDTAAAGKNQLFVALSQASERRRNSPLRSPTRQERQVAVEIPVESVAEPSYDTDAAHDATAAHDGSTAHDAEADHPAVQGQHPVEGQCAECFTAAVMTLQDSDAQKYCCVCWDSYFYSGAFSAAVDAAWG